MIDRIRNLLGLVDDNARLYRFEAGEVDREEFQNNLVLFNYLFDEEKGVVATLGPTWNLVRDPRFLKIENCFIRRRQNIFSPGETVMGQQVITGAFAGFSTDVSRLDQYATILGEGRHFRNAIARGEIRDEDGDPCHAKTFWQESDTVLWEAIKKECSNYFTKIGAPNQEATMLYALFKEDLIGLIDDYAELPLIDEFINSESGDVYEALEWDGETPIVYAEVNLLEKALTVRGSLRVIAAKVLDRLGFADHIRGGERLTDAETDELLCLVYTSNWPDDRLELVKKIILFVQAKNSVPFEERQRQQCDLGSQMSKDFIAKIKSGEIKQINRETDKPAEAAMDPAAAVVKSIQDNPYKRDLFMMLTEAEQTGKVGVAALLLPVFDTADYVVNEETFIGFVRQVRELRGGSRPAMTTEAGECLAEVPRYWNDEIGAYSKYCRKPLPCPAHPQEN